MRWDPSETTGNAHPTPWNSLGTVVALFQPINTLPTAITVPTGRSVGSLQVLAGSPFRAAAFPLIFTVALPALIVPLFAGGFWNAVPGGVGMCAGGLDRKSTRLNSSHSQ